LDWEIGIVGASLSTDSLWIVGVFAVQIFIVPSLIQHGGLSNPWNLSPQ